MKKRAKRRRREANWDHLSPAPKTLPTYDAAADPGVPLFQPQLRRNLFYDDEYDAAPTPAQKIREAATIRFERSRPPRPPVQLKPIEPPKPKKKKNSGSSQGVSFARSEGAGVTAFESVMQLEVLQKIVDREGKLNELRRHTRGVASRAIPGALQPNKIAPPPSADKGEQKDTGGAAEALNFDYNVDADELSRDADRFASLLRNVVEATVETVEAIGRWQRLFVRPRAFVYSGGSGNPHDGKPANYLLRVWSQLDFLDGVPQLRGAPGAVVAGLEWGASERAAAAACTRAAHGAGYGFPFRRNPFALAPAMGYAIAQIPNPDVLRARGIEPPPPDPSITPRMRRLKDAIGLLLDEERLRGALEHRERWCNWCGSLPKDIPGVVSCGNSVCRRRFCGSCIIENYGNAKEPAAVWDQVRMQTGWTCFLCDITVRQAANKRRLKELRDEARASDEKDRIKEWKKKKEEEKKKENENFRKLMQDERKADKRKRNLKKIAQKKRMQRHKKFKEQQAADARRFASILQTGKARDQAKMDKKARRKARKAAKRLAAHRAVQADARAWLRALAGARLRHLRRQVAARHALTEHAARLAS